MSKNAKHFFLQGLFFTFLGAVFLWSPITSSIKKNDPSPAAHSNAINLQEASKSSGLEFTHKNSPHFNSVISNLAGGLEAFYGSMSSSVSVTDVNQDGWPDVFLPSPEWGTKSKLFVNQRNGKFRDEAETYGLSDLPFPIRAGFFDCDNDGIQEMLLTTYKCPKLYKQKNNKFHLLSTFGASCTLTLAFNIFDYNGDSLLDIVMAPLARTVPNNLHNADNGPGGMLLFKNTGSCQFELAKKDLNENNIARFTHSIGIMDLRDNEQQDLWAATDFNVDRIFFQNTDNKYEAQKDLLNTAKAHNGMSIQPVYLNNDNNPSVYVSQIFEKGFYITGNQFWTLKNNQLTDSALELGIDNCGWSWGSQFLDLNNDGHLDLVVANGFLSGNLRKNYWPTVSLRAGGSKKFLGNPWNWSPTKDSDWSGHQRDCVFLNTGNGFIDIAESIHFDDEHFDGRGLVKLDMLNNGKLSLIVSNQRQSARIYLNKTENNNRWIGFKLLGTKSNKDAIGSKIKVTLTNDQILRYAHYPFNGYASQNDSRIHFGLGTQHAKQVSIRWPSGVEQTFTDLKENTYHTIQEGATP